MKASDFTKCLHCTKGVLHTGQPFFLRIQIEYHGVVINAVQKAAALEQAFGPIAAVLGPDDDLTQIMDQGTGLLCGDCMLRLTVPFALLEAMTPAKVPA